MVKNGIQSVPVEKNDFSPEPDFFEINGKKSKAMGSMIWFDIYDTENPDLAPYFYYRAFGDKTTSPSGIIRYGKDYCSFQEPQKEIRQMAMDKTKLICTTMQGDPEGRTNDLHTYEIKSINGDFRVHLSRRYIHVTEGNFLDMVGEWMPSTMVSYEDNLIPMHYLCAYAFFQGTFRGKPAVALGGMDRGYLSNLLKMMFRMNGFRKKTFVGLGFAAVNEDDSREWGIVYWSENKGMFFYGKDGQQTRISTNVQLLNVKWEKVPYLSDDTAVFSQATFFIPEYGLKFHYKPRYGRRGCGAEPEKTPGQIQSSGEWYEENYNVKRKYSFAFGESIGAFASKLVK